MPSPTEITISDLPPSTQLTGSEIVPIVQGGTTKQAILQRSLGVLNVNANTVLTYPLPTIIVGNSAGSIDIKFPAFDLTQCNLGQIIIFQNANANPASSMVPKNSSGIQISGAIGAGEIGIFAISEAAPDTLNLIKMGSLAMQDASDVTIKNLTMTGNLLLSADATTGLEATTYQQLAAINTALTTALAGKQPLNGNLTNLASLDPAYSYGNLYFGANGQYYTGTPRTVSGTTLDNVADLVNPGDFINFSSSSAKTMTLDIAGIPSGQGYPYYFLVSNSGSGALTFTSSAPIYGAATIPGGSGTSNTPFVIVRLAYINVECWIIESPLSLMGGTLQGQLTTTSIVHTKSDFYKDPNLKCISAKNQTLTGGQWTTVASYSGTKGVLKKIWLALANTDPGRNAIRIIFDGASTPQVGTNTGAGFNSANALAVDVLFSAAFGSTNYWANEISGCNHMATTEIGGYIAFDMPFNTSFSVQVFNDSTSGQYWCQAFYENSDVTPSCYFYMQPFAYTSGISNTGTVFKEFPLLSTSSANGVILKSVKVCIQTNGVNGWQEGKFRMYNGGAGMTTPQTYTAATPSNLSYYNQQPGVTEIFSSSGSEDFFLSSFNFTGLPLFNTKDSGILYNPTSNQLGSLTCYRNFWDVAPGAPASTNFVLTWTCGDQNTAVASSINFILGYVAYYA